MSRVANVSFITHDDAPAAFSAAAHLADCACTATCAACTSARQQAATRRNRVATIDGNWTGVDDNYPPNNCFPLKQD